MSFTQSIFQSSIVGRALSSISSMTPTVNYHLGTKKDDQLTHVLTLAMDPLSSGASAITAAEALVRALGVVQTVLKAPIEIQSLINDISDFQAVVSEVTIALKGRVNLDEVPPDSFRAFQGLVDKATTILHQLNKIVDRCVGQVDRRGAISTLGRLKWLCQRPAVRLRQKELREIKLGIAALWGAANS